MNKTFLRILGAAVALTAATSASAHPGHASGHPLLHALADAALPLGLVAIAVLAVDGASRGGDASAPARIRHLLGARAHLLAIAAVAGLVGLVLLAHA